MDYLCVGESGLSSLCEQCYTRLLYARMQAWGCVEICSFCGSMYDGFGHWRSLHLMGSFMCVFSVRRLKEDLEVTFVTCEQVIADKVQEATKTYAEGTLCLGT